MRQKFTFQRLFKGYFKSGYQGKKNCQKCLVSNSESSESGDDSLNEGPPKCHHCKKVKPMTEVNEEVDNEQEEVEIEVVDSEELGEKPEEEHRQSAQKNKISAK